MRNLCNTAALVPTSDDMTSAIKLRIRYMLQRLSAVILKDRNRSGYRLIKKAESILKRSKSYLCMNVIHHALCSYINGNYNETIQSVLYVQRRLQRVPYMYLWNQDDDIIMELRQLGMSYESIVNKFIISYYTYEPMLSIEELILESYAILQTTASDLLSIPPLVFLNFLLILSYTRLQRLDRRNAALIDLHSILHYDDGHHIHFLIKAISWEILGICQQICGDYHGAYQSYVNALNDEYNDFKQASSATGSCWRYPPFFE
ncbi:hypothetical protein FSP39_016723 [Pinctada imbricata]|uniref:Uncharacterized protein n=1 Tax=Pinctada imbricata TaxID=66713 RepID=A0AA88XJ87_PINIB|nr:hypothetical protein FSP39_016723 [Pinctada imbricata]